MRIAVTGAFGYSGRYIARRLLEAGHSVLTLTNSVQRKNRFGEAVAAHPFHFNEPGKLTETLRGVDALINTYWVRFNHQLFTHEQAVANTKIMFNAAKEAGVRRIVHVSITNPDIRSDLLYFRGKAELEETLMNLGLSYCILRPTVLFGKEDVLINNIAWALRHLPVLRVLGRMTTSSNPFTWTTWLRLRWRRRPARATRSSTPSARRHSRIVTWCGDHRPDIEMQASESSLFLLVSVTGPAGWSEVWSGMSSSPAKSFRG